MLKGCQRELIVLQTQKSALFESAYFVLRREKRCERKEDLLAEANRIISEGSEYFNRRRTRGGRLRVFLIGAMLGFLLGGGILATICLRFGA